MPGSRKPAYNPGFGLDKRMRELRKERGYTLRALADLAGVSPTYIGGIENGKVTNPGAYHLYRIALALRVPMEELMGVSRLVGRTRIARLLEEGKTVDEILKQNSEAPIDSTSESIEAGG